MLSEYIDRYNKFQTDNALAYHNHITFLSLNGKYYLIYNEKSNINANDLPICFLCDGVLKTGGDVYYYVAFEENRKKMVLEKLKDYNITIIDKSFNVMEFHDRNKRNNYLRTLIQPKKISFMNPYTIIGNYAHNFLGRKIPEPVNNLKIDEIYGFLKGNELTIGKVKLTSNKNSGVSIDEFENNDNKEISIGELEADNKCIVTFFSNTVSVTDHITKNFTKTASDIILEDYDMI